MPYQKFTLFNGTKYSIAAKIYMEKQHELKIQRTTEDVSYLEIGNQQEQQFQSSR